MSSKPSMHPQDDAMSEEEIQELAQLLIHGEIPKRDDESFFEEETEVDVYGNGVPSSLIDKFLDDEF